MGWLGVAMVVDVKGAGRRDEREKERDDGRGRCWREGLKMTADGMRLPQQAVSRIYKASSTLVLVSS